MVEQPVVSVHMMTYNHAPYIGQAIEGVLQQKTDFRFELVIGEDCSTDGTREIISNYQKKHPDIIRVVASEKNVGARKNDLRTAKACRGKYIAFCEGDDYWHNSHKLQKQADYLEERPEYGLVHSDHDRHYVTWGLTIRNFFRTSGNLPPENLNAFRGWGGYNILTCTVMARNGLLKEILLDSVIYGSNGLGGTDIPRFIEISMVSEIGFINESLATYRIHDESISNSTNTIHKARFYKSNIESFLYLAKKHGQEQERLRLEEAWPRAALWQACIEKDGQLAREITSTCKSLSIKERILFAGSQYWLAHVVLCLFYSFRFQAGRFLWRRRLKRLADY